jgi:putative ABC transport system permease protein
MPITTGFTGCSGNYAKTLYAMDGNDISPHSRAITASLLEGNFPEIDKVSVIREIGGKFLSKDVDHLVYDQYGIYADENFFDLFTYRFIEGQPAKALAEPFTVVISLSWPKKCLERNLPSGKPFYSRKIPGKSFRVMPISA